MPFPRYRAFPFFACCIVFLLLQAFAPGAVRAYEITVVKSDDINLYNEALDGFKSSCNCSVSVIDLAGRKDGNVISEVLDSSPDAVVAIGSRAYKTVRALKALPVLAMLVYPYDQAKEGNVWWVSTDIYPGKYLAAMTEVLPRAGRIGLIFNPALSGAYAGELARMGKEKGLQLLLKEVASVQDVSAALSSLSGKIDLLMMIPDTTVASDDSVMSMVSFSYQNSIPIMTFSRKFLEMGSLLSLDIEPFDIGRQTGELALSVLKDEHIRARGFYYARKALLTINPKIAAKLGIRISDRVLRKAEVLR